MNGKALPKNFSRFPLLWLSVCFAAGIVVACELKTEILIAAGIVSLVCSVAMLRAKASILLVPLFFLLLGAFCYKVEIVGIDESRVRRIYDDGRVVSDEPVEIEGVILGLPELSHGGSFVLLNLEKLTFQNSTSNISGKVRIFVTVSDETAARDLEELDLRHGSRITAYVRLRREESFQNPGVASRIEILDRRGIDATAVLKSPLLIEKIRDEPVFLPFAWIYEQRQSVITAFLRTFSPSTAGVMIASLLGDQHFLDRQTADIFRDGGTFHVLVISGLHITFIGALTVWLLSFITKRDALRFVIASVFLWAYTLAVGAEVPVVRASLMFTILLLSRLIYRNGTLLNSFGLCVLLLLVWRPSDLYSASFQLTIASVAAIVACAFPLIEKLRAIGSWTPSAETPFPANASRRLRRFCELLYWNHDAWAIENSRQIWSANLFKLPYLKAFVKPNLKRVSAYLFEGVLVSVIVQIWLLPLLVVYFHRVTPASVVLNLWVGALLALETFAAVIAVALTKVSPWLAAPLIVLTEWLNGSMMLVPRWFTTNDLASFRLPIYSGPMWSVYFLCGAAVASAAAALFRWSPFDLIKAPRRWKIAASSFGGISFVLGLLIIIHPFSAPRADGRLRIDFLDVGQGDSALVTFPDGETMLVDGGGRASYGGNDDSFEPDIPRIGESVVSEFLWERGYSRIDYVVATHADTDHMQGLSDVAENFEIGAVLVGRTSDDDPDFDELFSVVRKRSIAMTIIGRGDELHIGGAHVQIVNPEKDLRAHESTNDSSVVMKISFGSRSFLLTGDIEREGEREILGDTSYDFHSDVIKVPHHGSRTSSTEPFVRSVSPEIVVISVGRRSRFGHPHREVVERWRSAPARVLTTGESGTVTIVTDGDEIQVQTFIPKK